MHEYGLEESRALDQLETDCLNRLCPNIETADEETCDAYIAAIADYDAQETIKEQFIKRIEERVSAIWSTEDAAICRNIYMNTDSDLAGRREKILAEDQGKGAHRGA